MEHGTHVSSVETAGTLLMRVRDLAIGNGVALLDGRLEAPADREFARVASPIPRESRERLVATIVNDVLVALLSALAEDTDVELTVRGTSVARVSDGLAGELFGDRGWIAQMSRYPPSA